MGGFEGQLRGSPSIVSLSRLRMMPAQAEDRQTGGIGDVGRIDDDAALRSRQNGDCPLGSIVRGSFGWIQTFAAKRGTENLRPRPSRS